MNGALAHQAPKCLMWRSGILARTGPGDSEQVQEGLVQRLPKPGQTAGSFFWKGMRPRDRPAYYLCRNRSLFRTYSTLPVLAAEHNLHAPLHFPLLFFVLLLYFAQALQFVSGQQARQPSIYPFKTIFF